MASDDDEDERKLKGLTVRELRERAVKSLGAKASGLKTKQELIDALAGDDWGAATDLKPAPKKPAPAAAATTPARPLPVARDFFVDPRKPSLPAAYGDDRLLVFRREPLAVVVSWDLSMASWGDGKSVWLELVEPRGKLNGRADVLSQTGLATFEALPEHVPLMPQIIRHGRVMTRGRAFSLGPLIEDQLRYEMTVLWDEPLPQAPGGVAGEARVRTALSRAAGRPTRGNLGGPSSQVGRAGASDVSSSRLSSSRVTRAAR